MISGVFGRGSKPEEEAVPKETAHFSMDGGVDAPSGASLGGAANAAADAAGRAIETGKEMAAAAADKASGAKDKAADFGAKIKEKTQSIEL